VREGACIGVATMLQPWTLRLILNVAALAAANPTLLFRPWWNAARLTRTRYFNTGCACFPWFLSLCVFITAVPNITRRTGI
jgi:hypothetical protein